VAVPFGNSTTQNRASGMGGGRALEHPRDRQP
jgi:hypothetical protein